MKKGTSKVQNQNSKNLWVRLSGLIALSAFALACQPNVVEKDAGLEKALNSDSIIGGEVVNETSWLSKTVVAIYAKSGSLCTGALIDRNIILTAAHCVVDEVPRESGEKSLVQMKPQDLIVLFSRSVEACSQRPGHAFASACQLARVEEVLVHPAYFQGRRDLMGDVALIRIQGTAPDHYVPSSLTPEFIDPRETPYVAAGFGRIYGYNKEQEEPSELRTVVLSGVTEQLYARLGAFLKAVLMERFEAQGMQNTSQYAQIKEAAPQIIGEAIYPTAADSEIIPVDNSQGKGICAGDSGGAAFAQRADGVFVVTGVASTVGNPLGDEPCALVGNYMNVSFHKPWIEMAFQRIRSLSSMKTSPFMAR